MRMRSLAIISVACITALPAGVFGQSKSADDKKKPDFPKFAEVSKGFEKIVSTADGSKPLYAVYLHKKKNQLLAELPSGWSSQRYFIAVTQASGSVFAGLQGPTRYVYWKRYDKRVALIEPEMSIRATGDPASRMWVQRARLISLRGIGTRNAQHLEAVGISSVATLSAADPEELFSALISHGAAKTRLARVRVWVRGAQGLH